MGKASRRRGTAASTPVAAAPSVPAAEAKPAKAGHLDQFFQLDRWEQVVLMFICVSVTMNFLGNYVPGLNVLMESQMIGYVGSAVSVTGMAGLVYSLVGPGNHVSKIKAARANRDSQSAEAAPKRKDKQ